MYSEFNEHVFRASVDDASLERTQPRDPAASSGHRRDAPGGGACSTCPFCARSVVRSELSSHLLRCKKKRDARDRRVKSPGRYTPATPRSAQRRTLRSITRTIN